MKICSICKQLKNLFDFSFSIKLSKYKDFCKVCAEKSRCKSEIEKIRKMTKYEPLINAKPKHFKNKS